jgi:hypothetical protein
MACSPPAVAAGKWRTWLTVISPSGASLTLEPPDKTLDPEQTARVREIISDVYLHCGTSLLEPLQVRRDYRRVELSYSNVAGSCLASAAQLNLAVRHEVIL